MRIRIAASCQMPCKLNIVKTSFLCHISLRLTPSSVEQGIEHTIAEFQCFELLDIGEDIGGGHY